MKNEITMNTQKIGALEQKIKDLPKPEPINKSELEALRK